MKEMVKHVPDAGSYAPITILIDERADGVHIAYDTMVSHLAPYGNNDALHRNSWAVLGIEGRGKERTVTGRDRFMRGRSSVG